MGTDAQLRVLQYITSLLKIEGGQPKGSGKSQPADDEDPAAGEDAGRNSAAGTYASFAELADAAGPDTASLRALVAGYWFQECKGAESFTAAGANKELGNLGDKVATITQALDTLKGMKRALVIQLKKSGSSTAGAQDLQGDRCGRQEGARDDQWMRPGWRRLLRDSSGGPLQLTSPTTW